jgi:hypothetical protein
VENGETVLTLDAPTQKRLGLEVITLTARKSRRQVTAPAVVLPAQDLATFRNNTLAAQAQVQKSRIDADVARKEYARLSALFDQNHNVSEKSLESAGGTVQADEADVRTGEQQLALQESIVQQQWGGPVARWVAEGSPELQQVLAQRDLLVQMTLPESARLWPPKIISLEITAGAQIRASFVSSLPRVDPRVQGQSFLYLAPAHTGLAPGVNLVARLSIGNPMQGLILPTSAVVWSEGKAWVYQQTAPDRFTRRAIATDSPVENGLFIGSGLAPGDKVVIQGAQTLLSEELLLHGQGGAPPDVD